MSDSEHNEGYTTNAWYNDAYSDDNPISGIFSYGKYSHFASTERIPKYLRDGHLGLVYSAMLFIADRVLSRVWHPSQGSRDIIDNRYEVSARRLIRILNTRRIAAVVKKLRTQIEIGSNQLPSNENREIKNTRNISTVDEALLDLYAESAICIKLAEEYYPDDDEQEWKPMVDRYMALVWTAHL